MPAIMQAVAMETPRLLFVHAHPDDETLTTGATIAHYVARGAQVQVVTCTLGEEGEVIGDRWAQLAVDDADQLGGYRIGELTAALRALGVGEPMFLGGAGRWRDSGMAGTPPRHHQRFIDADPGEAVGALVAIIRELRPHVVVTYDPAGGYGHPDHIHAHEVTMAAVAASAGADYPGEPWAVPKFYWTVMATTAMAAGLDALGDVPAGVDPGVRRGRAVRLPRRRDRRGHRRAGAAARQGGCAAGACHAGHRRARRPVAARCRTTSRCRSARSSTTCWSRAPRARATTADGKPICWPG